MLVIVQLFAFALFLILCLCWKADDEEKKLLNQLNRTLSADSIQIDSLTSDFKMTYDKEERKKI